MSDDKTTATEETSQPDSEISDPDYLAWKERKISAAVKHADEHPEDNHTHDQVFDAIKQKFRP